MSNTAENTLKGISFSLLGYLCLALMSCCVKALPSTIPTATIVLFQLLTMLLLALSPIVNKGDFKDLHTQRPFLLFLRGFTGVLTAGGLFFAIKHIPLVDAILLQNTTPLFVPLIAFIWMKQTMPYKLWVSVITGFIGVLLILKPTAGILNPAALLALGVGVVSAITLIIIGFLKTTEPTNRILFYYSLVGIILTLPWVIMHWVPLSWHSLFLLIAIGAFMYLAQFWITQAFAYGKATTLAPFCYAAVVFSGLLGWLFWGHVPDKISFAGIVLVIIAGIATIILNKQDKEIEVGLTNEG